MEQQKVDCGWKGCGNSFPSVEGMNVHVQADHMVYRVLVQTEYQGPTNVVTSGYSGQRAPHREMKEEVMTQSANTTSQTPLQEPYSPMPLSGPFHTAPQLAPYPDPMGSSARRAKIETEVVMIDVEQEEVEEEEQEIGNEIGEEQQILQKSTDAVPTSGALVLNSAPAAPSSSSARQQRAAAVSVGGGASVEKKTRNFHSKYWTYTSQMSYLCSMPNCRAEFNHAGAARHHYISMHDENNNSERVRAPKVQEPVIRRRRSSVSTVSRRRSQGGKRQYCEHVGCTRFFMSRVALLKHVETEHTVANGAAAEMGVDDEEMNGEPQLPEHVMSDVGEDEDDEVMDRGDYNVDDDQGEEEEEEKDLTIQKEGYDNNNHNNSGVFL